MNFSFPWKRRKVFHVAGACNTEVEKPKAENLGSCVLCGLVITTEQIIVLCLCEESPPRLNTEIHVRLYEKTFRVRCFPPLCKHERAPALRSEDRLGVFSEGGVLTKVTAPTGISWCKWFRVGAPISK